MQSVIAVVGAVGLQSGATEGMDRIQKRMMRRIAVIVGEDLDKRTKQQEEVEKSMTQEMEAGKKTAYDKRPLEARLKTNSIFLLDSVHVALSVHAGSQ